MLGSTFIQVIGNNIEFNNRLEYYCRFDETEIQGVHFKKSESSVNKILCVSPPLRRIGRIKFTLSYSDPPNNERQTVATDTYFSCKSYDCAHIVIITYIQLAIYLHYMELATYMFIITVLLIQVCARMRLTKIGGRDDNYMKPDLRKGVLYTHPIL